MGKYRYVVPDSVISYFNCLTKRNFLPLSEKTDLRNSSSILLIRVSK